MDTVIFTLISDSSVLSSTGFIIPFQVDNTDYQLFKTQINNDMAELQGIDRKIMSPEEAKAYVATLP
jgi:hypothetical protein